MRHGNGAVVAIATVLLWGFVMPMAMAAGLCTMMGALCEGPCGATLAASGPTAPVAIDLIGPASTAPVPTAPAFERAVPEPPPRAVFPSA